MRNSVPPGSRGTFTVGEEPAAATGTLPPNFTDQLEMFDDLPRHTPGITSAVIGEEYKDAPLGVRPEDIVRVDRPKAGVTILRDKAGVPHIYGATHNDVAWGAGYAGTEDRFFLQDVLRHVGAARLAEFLGPSASNVAMDRDQLRLAGYTDAEAQAQIDQLSDRFGAEGQTTEEAVDAYLAGINAFQHQACPPGGLGIAAPSCPVEYGALQQLPKDWSRKDITYIASLVGGIFGKGGGGEVAKRPLAPAAAAEVRSRCRCADVRRPARARGPGGTDDDRQAVRLPGVGSGRPRRRGAA